MIKYIFLFFPQPKQAPNQTDTQCVHQTFSHRRGALIGLPLLQDRGIRNAGRLFFALHRTRSCEVRPCQFLSSPLQKQTRNTGVNKCFVVQFNKPFVGMPYYNLADLVNCKLYKQGVEQFTPLVRYLSAATPSPHP